MTAGLKNEAPAQVKAKTQKMSSTAQKAGGPKSENSKSEESSTRGRKGKRHSSEEPDQDDVDTAQEEITSSAATAKQRAPKKSTKTSAEADQSSQSATAINGADPDDEEDVDRSGSAATSHKKIKHALIPHSGNESGSDDGGADSAVQEDSRSSSRKQPKRKTAKAMASLSDDEQEAGEEEYHHDAKDLPYTPKKRVKLVSSSLHWKNTPEHTTKLSQYLQHDGSSAVRPSQELDGNGGASSASASSAATSGQEDSHSSIPVLAYADNDKQVPAAAAAEGARHSNDNMFVATASEDSTVRLWDCVNSNMLAILQHSYPVRNLQFTPQNSKLVSVCAVNNTISKNVSASESAAACTSVLITVWDLQSQAKVLGIEEQVTAANRHSSFLLALDAAETRVLTASLSMYNLATGAKMMELQNANRATHSSNPSVRAMCFSSDDSLLIVSFSGPSPSSPAGSHEIVLFDAETGEPRLTLFDHPHADSIQFLVSCPHTYTYQYQAPAQAPTPTPTFASADVHSITVWNHQSYQQIFHVRKDKEFINGVCFGGSPNILMCCCVYGLNIWDIASNVLLVDIYTYVRMAHVAYNVVSDAAVVTNPNSNRISMFSVTTGEKLVLANGRRHGKFVHALACSPSTAPPHDGANYGPGAGAGSGAGSGSGDNSIASIEALSSTLLSLSSSPMAPVGHTTIRKTYR